MKNVHDEAIEARLNEIRGYGAIILGESKVKTDSICTMCARCAAPPTVQCIWDATKGVVLPEGAEIRYAIVLDQVNAKRTGTNYKVLCKVQKCPQFLSLDEPENVELLKRERKKIVARTSNNIAQFWNKTMYK